MDSLISRKAAFTLIELLIVVAIIAILAAIAVPNFLEAQTRSKISRAKADMRSIAVGVESFRLDNNRWPTNTNATFWGSYLLWTEYINELTTPIAYLSSNQFVDAFNPARLDAFSQPFIPVGSIGSYFYADYSVDKNPYSWGYGRKYNQGLNYPGFDAFGLFSWGPDRNWDRAPNMIEQLSPPPAKLVQWAVIDLIYDPTNGTISDGDIGRFGGAAPANTTP